MNQALGSGESKLETVISYLLITGVVVSLCLEVVGIILFYRDYGHLNILENQSLFLRGQNFFSFLGGVFQGEQDSAIRLMTLGIATLILTPYLRAIASVLYFAWRKDARYLLITAYVLLVLTISLAVH